MKTKRLLMAVLFIMCSGLPSCFAHWCEPIKTERAVKILSARN